MNSLVSTQAIVLGLFASSWLRAFSCDSHLGGGPLTCVELVVEVELVAKLLRRKVWDRLTAHSNMEHQ